MFKFPLHWIEPSMTEEEHDQRLKIINAWHQKVIVTPTSWMVLYPNYGSWITEKQILSMASDAWVDGLIEGRYDTIHEAILQLSDLGNIEISSKYR